MNQKLTIHEDDRGALVEVFKIPTVGQLFYSTSKPGIVRGNHYHTRKIETFCVIEGSAKISMRNRESGEVKEYLVSGDQPQTVEMPLNWTHNIQNIGNTEMKLLVWASEIFDSNDPDTYPEQV